MPILKIIEYDVRELTILTQKAIEGMTVENLRTSGYQFRELPLSVSFVLDNADLLPGDAILSVPQLLSLRELVANDIRVVLRHRELGHALVLYREGLRLILRWLVLTRSTEILRELHDEPITRLLRQDCGDRMVRDRRSS